MLDERLMLCASFMRRGKKVCDVGTDHAYLPIYLAGQGICESALACDLREGPLSSARENIAAAGLSDKIRTLLCDGLSAVSADDADDIVIAGMGGHLIVSIISAAKWLEDPDKRLILQPMTDADALRAYLYKNGYDIICERAVTVGRHIYSVMNAVYDGRPRDVSEAKCRTGGLADGGEKELMYIRREISRLTKKAEGLSRAASPDLAPDDVMKVINELRLTADKMEAEINGNG